MEKMIAKSNLEIACSELNINLFCEFINSNYIIFLLLFLWVEEQVAESMDNNACLVGSIRASAATRVPASVARQDSCGGGDSRVEPIKEEEEKAPEEGGVRDMAAASNILRKGEPMRRFSMLTDAIPHGDRKRHKAPFLLEVAGQILFRGWINEQLAMTTWRVTEDINIEAKTSSSVVNGFIWCVQRVGTTEVSRAAKCNITLGRTVTCVCYGRSMAEEIFEKLQETGIELDVYAYNALMEAYRELPRAYMTPSSVADSSKRKSEKMHGAMTDPFDGNSESAEDTSGQMDSPSWAVRLGRRGSTDSNTTQAVEDLSRESRLKLGAANENERRQLLRCGFPMLRCATDLGSNEVETVVVEEDFVRKDEAQGSPFVDLSIVSANNQIFSADMINAGTSEVVKDDAQGMKFCCPQAHATHDAFLIYANVDIDDLDVRDRG
ncbi:hypothetical protein Tco_0548118 [Tanacetum coccineum]